MNNYSAGKLFKKLRTSQNITLKEAVRNIDNLTPSRLSHWENDSSNMPLYKLDQLLYNIHILPNEFVNLIGLRFVNHLTIQVHDAFVTNNEKELEQLAQKQLKKYYSVKDNTELFLAALTCNFYFQKSEINIFPNNLKNKITKILSEVNLWNEYYITTFGNTISLLNANEIYKIASSLTKNMDYIQKSGIECHIYGMIALLNANTALLLKSPQLAQKLFKQIDKIELNQFDLYSSLYEKFLLHLINYRLTDNKQDLRIACELTEICEFINRKEISNELKVIISKVQKLSK